MHLRNEYDGVRREIGFVLPSWLEEEEEEEEGRFSGISFGRGLYIRREERRREKPSFLFLFVWHHQKLLLCRRRRYVETVTPSLRRRRCPKWVSRLVVVTT